MLFRSMVPWSASQLAMLFLAVERTIGAAQPHAVKSVALEALKLMGMISAVPLVVTASVFTATLWLQTGAVFSLEPSLPKLDNLNPASGLKKLFSAKTLVQAVQMLFKTAIISVAVVLVMRQVVPDAIRVIHADVGAALVVARAALMHLLIWCGALFVILGAADLGFQRWQFLRDNRMSKSEVKRELKEDEGDAEVKQERKRCSQEPGFEDQLKYLRVASLVLRHSDGRLVVFAYRPAVHPTPIYVLRARSASAEQVLAASRQRQIAEVYDDDLLAALFAATQTGAPIAEASAPQLMAHLRRARS